MRRGRKARLAAPPAACAIRPGLPGGHYRPLTQTDEQQNHQTILKVLENSSCDIITIEVLKITEKTGLAATLDDKQWNAFCRKAKGGYSDRRTR